MYYWEFHLRVQALHTHTAEQRNLGSKLLRHWLVHAVASVLLSSPPVAMFCWTYVLSSTAGARAQHCHLGSFEPRENWEQHVWSAHAHAQLARSHFTNSFNVWMDLACTALLAVAYCYSNKVEIRDQLSLSQYWDSFSLSIYCCASQLCSCC